MLGTFYFNRVKERRWGWERHGEVGGAARDTDRLAGDIPDGPAGPVSAA